MRTHKIHVSDGEETVQDIRRELFVFPEVLEVFATGPDVVVVVCAGRPRPGEWLSALRAVGYRTPARSQSTSVSAYVRPKLLPAVGRSNGKGDCDGKQAA